MKNKPVERNPEGTPQNVWRCKYHHPKFCNVLGHKDARSPFCVMKKANVSKRLAADKAIFQEKVDVEVEKNNALRKYKEIVAITFLLFYDNTAKLI